MISKRTILNVGLRAGCGLGLASAASAALMVDVTSGSHYSRGTWANFGFSFTVHDPVRVDALGLLDVGANGLADAHDVGLWNDAGALLAHALVDNTGSEQPSAGAGYAWRFSAITPIILQPGTYKLGAPSRIPSTRRSHRASSGRTRC